ncbi:MAG TPA: flagellar type III secretion system pore protein FliP [Candidatus Baltobacteraceae bacterium]
MHELLTIAARDHALAPLDLLAGLAAVSLIPLVLVMCTSFVRIVVVLSLLRSAIGASAVPPNALLVGLAMTLTLVVMGPTIQRIRVEAIAPYAQGRATPQQTLDRAILPLRTFMLRQTRPEDVTLFERVGHRGRQPARSASLDVLVPAYVVGELRSAFAIGFALYLPFVAIDLAVAGMLMGLGMMMLSPPVVSLPIKLLLFVLVDGWALICGGVVASFR